MPTKHMFLAFQISMIVLTTCTHTTSENNSIGDLRFQGIWQDHLDTTLFYFGYSLHRLEIQNDSFFLKITEATDIARYGDTCSSVFYNQYIKGTYVLENGDSITLKGIFVDSLKNPLPDCPCTYGPKQSGIYQVSFKWRLGSGVLYLTKLPILYEPEWELEKTK
jgi:hypothetical protein